MFLGLWLFFFTCLEFLAWTFFVELFGFGIALAVFTIVLLCSVPGEASKRVVSLSLVRLYNIFVFVILME